MKKVVIIGGGFAGRAAARILRAAAGQVRVTLIDRSPVASFQPLLPDCIGRGVRPQDLTVSLEGCAARLRSSFVCAEVTAVDPVARTVLAGTDSYTYDYLLLACGSVTSFYGNDQVRRSALKLDDAEDARAAAAAVRAHEGPFVIVGGGYTGIEIATNIRRLLERCGRHDARITIVERAPALLGPLPQWMKEYVGCQLRKMEIEVLFNTQLEEVSRDALRLCGGQTIERPLLVWAAGVEAPAFLRTLKLPHNPQGRLAVDTALRAQERIYVAGDAACFPAGGACLRMGVQFSLVQGSCAAAHILRDIRGRPMRIFKPQDKGYVVPLANSRSCGVVLGMPVRGRLATALHYFMCVLRLHSWGARWGVLRALAFSKRERNA